MRFPFMNTKTKTNNTETKKENTETKKKVIDITLKCSECSISIEDSGNTDPIATHYREKNHPREPDATFGHNNCQNTEITDVVNGSDADFVVFKRSHMDENCQCKGCHKRYPKLTDGSCRSCSCPECRTTLQCSVCSEKIDDRSSTNPIHTHYRKKGHPGSQNASFGHNGCKLRTDNGSGSDVAFKAFKLAHMGGQACT
jgi:hypothetical protein